MEMKYRICIAKTPDRAKPVADIFFEDTQWAEVNQDGPELQIEFFPGPNHQPWHLSPAATESALQKASERLTAGTKAYRKDSLSKIRQKRLTEIREASEHHEPPTNQPNQTNPITS